MVNFDPGKAAQTIDPTDVFINGAGGFFNTKANANGSVSVTLGNKIDLTFASMGAFQGFVLLYELGHQMNVYGGDLNDAINARNSEGVLDHCFKQDGAGSYY